MEHKENGVFITLTTQAWDSCPAVVLGARSLPSPVSASTHSLQGVIELQCLCANYNRALWCPSYFGSCSVVAILSMSKPRWSQQCKSVKTGNSDSKQCENTRDQNVQNVCVWCREDWRCLQDSDLLHQKQQALPHSRTCDNLSTNPTISSERWCLTDSLCRLFCFNIIIIRSKIKVPRLWCVKV